MKKKHNIIMFKIIMIKSNQFFNLYLNYEFIRMHLKFYLRALIYFVLFLS